MKNIIMNIRKVLVLTASVFAGVMLVSSSVMAAGGGNENLDEVYINMNDKESLRNGAEIFAQNCLTCHSAQYARYNRVAEDLDIPLDALKGRYMFASEKTGDRMVSNMSVEDAKKWFGVTPKDLTLVSRVRKPNWVYTYLRSFYKDDSSLTGWNNSLFENVAMPHVLWEMQGSPELISLPEKNKEEHADDDHGHAKAEVDESIYIAGGAKFDMSNRGAMSNAEFDSAMRDLTNYLVYLAEPAIMKRKTIGVWTLAFLIILLGLVILLKKEYWRDVH